MIRALINDFAIANPAATVIGDGDGLWITISSTTRWLDLFEADALLKYAPGEMEEMMVIFAQRGVGG